MAGDGRAPLMGPVFVGVATALAILGVAVAFLLNPIYIHAALDDAGSARILGVSPAQAAALSDRTVGEILLGPGTFAFPIAPGGPPFYDASEVGHLRDVRVVLYSFIGVVAASAILLVIVAWRTRRSWPWHAMSRGAAALAVALICVGLFFTVSFDTAFELFHRIFFPGGNWMFNEGTERLVQLYPTPFWESTATVLAVVALGMSVLVWYAARARAGRLEAATVRGTGEDAEALGAALRAGPPPGEADAPGGAAAGGTES